MSSADIFFCPPDVAEAKEAWGAASGPASLAAILKRPVMELSEFFPKFITNKCIYQRRMYKAIQLCTGRDPVITRACGRGNRGRVFPGLGVACIQFGGDWTDEPYYVRWRKHTTSRGKEQYQHAHWVSSRATACGIMLYDVTVQQWLILNDWVEDVLPSLLDDNKSGYWWCRMGYEVRT